MRGCQTWTSLSGHPSPRSPHMAFRLTPWPKRGRRNERAHTPERHQPTPASSAPEPQLTGEASEDLLRGARLRKAALSGLRDDDDIDLPAAAPGTRAKP